LICGAGLWACDDSFRRPQPGEARPVFEYSFGLKEEAAAVDKAIIAVLDSGYVTADLQPSGAPATTEHAGQAVCAAIR
jgi:3-isopropylmalate dehydrogenase